jgi:hypothetical protein
MSEVNVREMGADWYIATASSHSGRYYTFCGGTKSIALKELASELEHDAQDLKAMAVEAHRMAEGVQDE